jgi:hypothetical protein
MRSCLRICELLGDQEQGLGAALSTGDENGSLSGDDQQRGTVCGVATPSFDTFELVIALATSLVFARLPPVRARAGRCSNRA